MTLRTTSLKHQYQVWTVLAVVGIVVYFGLVFVFGLGNPFWFFGAHQMRVFIPVFIIFRVLANECRWDGVKLGKSK